MAVVHDYFSISQLCERWKCDLNQLQDIIEKQNVRLWACIKAKRSRFNENIVLQEAKTNTLKTDEFLRLSRLTNTQLEEEGFNILPQKTSNSFLAKKGGAQIFITQEDNGPRVVLPPFTSVPKKLTHDGFVELCKTSFINPQASIANLFSKDELYICTVACERKGYIRFLKPACFIILQDIYVHKNEIERIENCHSMPQNQISPSVKMLPHVKKANQVKRADQVTALYIKICVDHPIKIDKSKITEPVSLINLSWILAFCRMQYDSFASVDFRNLALNAMQENIRSDLIMGLGLEEKLNSKCAYLDEANPVYDDKDMVEEEADLVYGATVTKTLNYIIQPAAVIALLTNSPTYSRYLIDESGKENETTPKPKVALPKMVPSEESGGNSPADYEQPSKKCRDKSEIISLELEAAVTATCIEPLNSETLWKALMARAEKDPQSLLKKESSALLHEPATGTFWSKESARYHIDKVITWHLNKKKTDRK